MSLTAQLGAQGDASLLHYLHKKSYEKAQLYLEGRDAENARGAAGIEHAGGHDRGNFHADGEGGLAVIRLSGSRALRGEPVCAAERLRRAKPPRTRCITGKFSGTEKCG